MNENVKTAIWVGVALIALKLVRDIFGESAEDKRIRELAERFPNLWELFSPRPLQDGMERGVVFPYQVQQLASSPAIMAGITRDIVRLKEAPSRWYRLGPSAIDDNERAAVASILMRGTYQELLLFSNMFALQEGTPVGPFLLGFMSPSGIFGDAEAIAVIVAHVEALRPR